MAPGVTTGNASCTLHIIHGALHNILQASGTYLESRRLGKERWNCSESTITISWAIGICPTNRSSNMTASFCHCVWPSLQSSAYGSNHPCHPFVVVLVALSSPPLSSARNVMTARPANKREIPQLQNRLQEELLFRRLNFA